LGKISGLANMLRGMDDFKMYVDTNTIKSMEDVGYDYGVVVYSTNITFRPSNPAVLNVPGLRDRGYIYVDHEYKGIISRADNLYNIALHLNNGSRVDIVVENQGRVCFGDVYDRKGIISDVTIGKHTLGPWRMYHMPRKASDFESNQPFAASGVNLAAMSTNSQKPDDNRGFNVYGAFMMVPENQTIYDTFLRLDGWTKGYVLFNNFTLGRYWPAQGPQQTLYLPGVYFNTDGSPQQIIVIEQEMVVGTPTVKFVKEHVINGDIPD